MIPAISCPPPLPPKLPESSSSRPPIDPKTRKVVITNLKRMVENLQLQIDDLKFINNSLSETITALHEIVTINSQNIATVFSELKKLRALYANHVHRQTSIHLTSLPQYCPERYDDYDTDEP